MGREITAVRTCDAVIIVGGRSGTLGEFAIAYDEGKVVGVLLGTGGLADHIQTVVEICNKSTGSVVIYDDDSERLVKRVLQAFHGRLEDTHDEAIIAAYEPLSKALGEPLANRTLF
jgi:predicted Rossmann-fold nucleotide-binding protein